MPTDDELDHFQRAAVEWARKGGAAALRRIGDTVVQRKSDQSPVTDADQAVQDLLVEGIRARFPDHGVLVEEPRGGAHGVGATGSPFCWVVDPIDGTRNYARGLRLFATSVGLLHEGEPVAGALFDGATQRVYSARRGGGAYCEHVRLRIADRPVDTDTTLAVSSFRFHPLAPGLRRLLDRLLFRNVGAACLHLAWVAHGLIDGVYGPDFKLWDVAAGALLVAEAGGVVTDETGRPRWPVDPRNPADGRVAVLAGRPQLHALVLDHLRGVG